VAGEFTMTNCQRSLPGRVGVPLRVSILAFAATLAGTMAAKAIDLDELTVVTLARDGSWGVATAGSQGPAIAAAIRHCRKMSVTSSDCGAQFITTRGSWVVANLCGDQKIIVAGETREAAEQAAIKREIDLKQNNRSDLPTCRRILTINAHGAVVTETARAPGTDQRDCEVSPYPVAGSPLRAELTPVPAECAGRASNAGARKDRKGGK
jgi:hypothetical protein